MTMMSDEDDHDDIQHGLYAYRMLKCKCPVCMEANREYNRERRETRRAQGDWPPKPAVRPTRKRPVSNVVNLKTKTKATPESSDSPPKTRKAKPGDIEQAVIDECALLGTAAERPAAVAQAKAMARILDNPKHMAQHSTASRQLSQIMDGLRATKKTKSGGRLAAVQQMTKSRRAQ